MSSSFFSIVFIIVAFATLPRHVLAKELKRSAKKSASSKVAVKKPTPAKTTSAKSKTASSRSNGSNLDKKFDESRKTYRLADRDSGQLWAELESFDSRINELSKENQISLLQTQASILLQAGYPYVSALYSAEALRKAGDPLQARLRPSWMALWQASQKRQMQSLLEDLAFNLKGVTQAPPGFANSWFYYDGNAEQNKGDAKGAIADYEKLRINDYHFLSAKYQTAMIHLANERTKPAELALKTMLNSAAQTMAPLPESSLKEMANYAKLALARLYYENKQFKNSVVFFRAVDRDSKLFYDALFEQSWAFFMAGYPNHSLGALHGAESPFFKDVFNPEVPILRAITYYWMCRYDDSRLALADFSKRHAEAVESLDDFLSKKRLSPETAYQLFEDYISGVSPQTLGIPKNVLESAATEDSMLLLRDQYAGIVAESDRMENQGVYASRKTAKATEALNKQLKAFRSAIGEQYIVELQSLKKHFERLNDQAQFLYVELLMSEKEQLLGRELHASTKIDRITQKKNISVWGDKNQSWGDNRLNEFWWDEVGFYIYDVQPMCKTGH